MKDSSTPRSFIFSFMASLNSKSVGAWFFSSVWTELYAARRKENMVTPGTVMGYWNARKSPLFALLSGVKPRILWPSIRMSPFVTLYFVCPSRVKARVLLPDPLGPIRACTSPWFIVRSTPFRISFPSTETWRSRISSLVNSESIPVSRA